MKAYLVRSQHENTVHLMMAAANNLHDLWNVVDEVMDPNVCEYTPADFGLISVSVHMVDVENPGPDEPAKDLESITADETGLLTEAAFFYDEGQKWRPLDKYSPFNKRRK